MDEKNIKPLPPTEQPFLLCDPHSFKLILEEKNSMGEFEWPESGKISSFILKQFSNFL